MIVHTLLLHLLLATSNPAPSFSDLDKTVPQLTAGLDGNIGVAVLEIETGREFSFHGDERFPMGSVFKFPVAIEVLHRVDAGKLRLTDSITLQPHDLHPGFSPIRDKAKGHAVTLTLDSLLVAMLRDSDNSAADYLMTLVGGPAAVTQRLRLLGIEGIRIDRSEAQMTADLWSVKQLPPEKSWTPDVFKTMEAHVSPDEREAGRAEYAIDPRDTATPKALVALLTKLEQGKLGLSKKSNDRMLRLMTETKTGMKRIHSVLPPGVTLAHKTGTMPGTANDAGVITLPNGRHLVLVVLVKGTKGEAESVEPAIAKVAKAVYDAAVGE